MDKLGIIAGGGGLPMALADACRAAGRPYAVLGISGMAEPELISTHDGEAIDIARLGRFIDRLKAQGCRAICFVGRVLRPDFRSLKPDLVGMQTLPSILAAAGKGDDALLRAILSRFEKEGFRIEGADAAAASLTLAEGPLGSHAPSQADLDDIAQAAQVARAVGRFDVGQGVVAAHGLVLAVEAQEGTAAMLERVTELPQSIRSPDGARRGALVKLPKPGQDRRIDLPTIGVATVEAAAAAGLAGIAGEARGLLIVDKDAVREAADRLGLYVYGLAPGA
jgi:UDP-2,3-diacylglucosamine hydrolase